MAFNDAFGFFGHYSFSAKPTHGRAVYEAISENMGESYNSDFNSLNSTRLYASAVCIASAQYQLDRALNNRDVSKATELLIQLEKDFQVTPGRLDTLKQRRDFLSALVKISKGNSQGAIEAALSTLLGTDFVSYSHLTPEPWPSDPGTKSIFGNSGETVKQFKITDCIATTGVPIDVRFSIVGSSDVPIPGEGYIIDPDPTTNIEKIFIEAVAANVLTATFYRSHEIGALATRPYPFWSSDRRYSTVVVVLSAAQDAEKRRKINDLMARASRGVSQWAVVSDQGSFILDSSTSGILGSTVLA
jgi:hypothetical protein